MRIEIVIAAVLVSLYFISEYNSERAKECVTVMDTVQGNDVDIRTFNNTQRTCALEFILRTVTVEFPGALEKFPEEDLTRLKLPPAEHAVACVSHVTGSREGVR